MHPSEEPAAPEPGEYTIDELAAQTGIPSRTIRFYQAKGVLQAPKKRGRVAFYDDSHAERLKSVGQLMDKGLRLRAIRDIVCREDLDSDAIHKWLGIGERLTALATDAPELLSEDDIRKRMGDLQPGVLSRLVRKGAIEVTGDGANRRYLVRSPALLDIGKRLGEAGIDIDTAIALEEILQRRFAKTAHELVEYAIKNLGHGFGRTAEPDAILSAVEAVFRAGVGTEAVCLIFNREIEQAVRAALQLDSTTVRGRLPRRHR